MEAEAPQGLHELLTRGALYRARAVRGQREGSGQAVGRRCRGGAGAVQGQCGWCLTCTMTSLISPKRMSVESVRSCASSRITA